MRHCRRLPTLAIAALLACAAAAAAAAAVASVDQEPPKDATASPRTEIVDLRTSHSRTFRLDDGDRLVEVYAAPIHERDDQGGWRQVDTAVRRTESGLEAEGVAGFAARLPFEAGAAMRASRNGVGVSLRLRGAQGTASARGDEVTYADVFDGVDARYTSVAHGLKEDLVLHDARAPRVFAYDLDVDPGLRPRLVEGRVDVSDGERTVLMVPRPFMYEQGDPAEISHDVRYELDEVVGGWRLRVVADSGWLDDPARRFPVVVDPTLTTGSLSSGLNCSITQGNMRIQECGPTYPTLKVGQLTDYWRSFIKFNIPSLPARSSILTSTMTLNATHAQTAPGQSLQVARVTQDWNAGLTWKSSGLSDWPAGGAFSNNEITVPGSTLTTTGAKAIDVSEIAREWYTDPTLATAPYPNYGVAVSGPQAASSGMQFSSSASSTNQPKLEVRYEIKTGANNVVESPTEGQQTARRIKLQAKATDAGITGVKWEYKKPGDTEFSEIPVGTVRDALNKPVTAWPVGMEAAAADGTRKTKEVTWDLTAIAGVEDGPIKVRAYFVPDGSGGTAGPGGASVHRNIRLYRKDPSSAASAPIASGSVNLLTGNFTLARTDVDIDSFKSDLTVSRTYHSRGVNKRTADMFGPGWESSVGADGPGMPYRSLYNITEWEPGEIVYDPDEDAFFEEFYEVHYAKLELIDGSKVTFRDAGDGFHPEDEANDLELSRVDGRHLELVDSAGNVTRFESPADGQPEYKPVSFHEPAATNQTILDYSILDAGTTQPKLRLRAAFAPTPASAPCNPSNATGASCRRLEFVYATSTTGTATVFGDYNGRLKQVVLHAYSPSSGAAGSWTVAEYRYDDKGRLRKAFDPRLGEALGEQYTYEADTSLLRSVKTGTDEPWTLSYATPTAADPSTGRLSTASRPNVNSANAIEGAANTWTVKYDIPLRDTGAPHQMGGDQITAWSQKDVPTDATAIFPPDPATGAGPGTAPDYNRADIVYMDRQGRTTNVAEPGGGVSTTERDTAGNIIRELSPANRHAALNPPTGTTPIAATSAERAKLLDTQHQYDGPRLIEKTKTLEPLHSVRIPGQTDPVLARRLTLTTYDEGAPTTTPATDYHLPTTVRVGAVEGTGNTDVTTLSATTPMKDVRKTTYGYKEGTTNRGWDLREPSETVVDADGLKLKTTVVHHPVEPLVVEQRTPAYNGTVDENVTRFSYYGAELVDDGAGVQGQCGGREHWYGLLCLERQMATEPAGYREKHHEYDHLQQPTRVQTYDARANVRREARTEYDTAGRIKTKSVAGTLGNTGAAIPTTTTTYDSSGRVGSVSDGTRSVSYGYDRLGRQRHYTDATTNLSSTTYDRLDRPVTTNDGKATQTRTYDAVTGRLTTLQDSSLGTFTAGYDDVGRLVRETLPNGVIATTTIDETGAETGRSYARPPSGCTQNCVWFDESVRESIHGQWLTHDSTLADHEYAYDPAGRLTQVKETRAGSGCTTRQYTLDRDSNRTKLVSIPPLTGGACNTNSAQGTAKTHSYDAADRLTDTGTVHDGFGRVTRMPASAAGGHELTGTYYVNDRVKSQTQNGVTNEYALDPLRRSHTRTNTQAAGTTTETYRYSDDSDNVAWFSEGTNWTRMARGLTGDLAAVEASNGTKILKLTNLHGDVVGDASLSTTATGPLALFDGDEFGVPQQPSSRRLLNLGGKHRFTDLQSGVVRMGARSYVPSIGRFTSADPIPGASANAYDYANQDPVNQLDLDGCAPRKRRVRIGGNEIGIVGPGQFGIQGGGFTTEWAAAEPGSRKWCRKFCRPVAIAQGYHFCWHLLQTPGQKGQIAFGLCFARVYRREFRKCMQACVVD